jgi:hypothetical protein
VSAPQNSKLARKLVREVLDFSRDDEDIAVNGYDRRNRDRLVRHIATVLAASPARVIELVVRHPDYENEYTTETVGNVVIEHFEIDLGSMFNGPKDFDSDDPERVEWVQAHIEEVAHLPEDSDVRGAVESLMNELLNGGF